MELNAQPAIPEAWRRGDQEKRMVAILEITRRIKLWSLIWLTTAMIIILVTMRYVIPADNLLYINLILTIIAFCILMSFTDYPIVLDLITWIKKLNKKDFTLNISTKWFEWIKWISIIAAISYVQAITSDKILFLIVQISYVALYCNIAVQTFEKFNGINKYSVAYLKKYRIFLVLTYILSIEASFSFILFAHQIIQHMIIKIQEAKLL